MIVNTCGRKVQIDTDLFLLHCQDYMRKNMIRPDRLLFSASVCHDLTTCVYDFLIGLLDEPASKSTWALAGSVASQIVSDQLLSRRISRLEVDDSDWANDYCPELKEAMRVDFLRHFPQYHNLIGAGLLRKEVALWGMDRMYAAGIMCAFTLHRLRYHEQREEVADYLDMIFTENTDRQMHRFYVEKIEDEVLPQIDHTGHRNYWHNSTTI